MTDIPSTCSNHRKGALLIISSYVLGITGGRNCFYLYKIKAGAELYGKEG